jgi:fimbrial chaperone protein
MKNGDAVCNPLKFYAMNNRHRHGRAGHDVEYGGGAIMRSAIAKLFFAGVLLLTAQISSRAATLQVEPVLIDVTAPAAASTITLRNEGTAPINVQVRIFRWSQVDGKETLEPTEDVVASPPAVALSPKANYITRIVRVTKRPVAGEESYRILVDQLPDATQQKGNTVNLLMRCSIPVFFGAADRGTPKVAWTVAVTGSKVKVTAHNEGERRIRIATLNVRDGKGKTVTFGKGLVGYVLGKSSVSWTTPAAGLSSNGPVSVSAQSDGGPVEVTGSITSAR